MLNVYICEDIKIQRERIKRIVTNIILMENLDMTLQLSTNDPNKLLSHVKEQSNVGIYFLDIDLNTDMDGLMLAKELRTYDPRGFIIFITTHSEMSYMTFIYKLEAMDFILKDNEEEIDTRIRECLCEICSRLSSQNNTLQANFVLKVNEKQLIIPYNEILFFETATNAHKIILHGTNRLLEFSGNLNEISTLVDKRFYRCHRSYLLNTEHIQEINLKERTVLMKNGETCLVSFRMMKGLKKL